MIAFVWIFGPTNAWRSIYEGADIRIPPFFKFVITYVTPVYLLIILVWWGATDALPILGLSRAAGGGAVVATAVPYIWAARAALLSMAAVFLVLIHWAWRRNGYDDRAGLPEVPELPEGDRA